MATLHSSLAARMDVYSWCKVTWKSREKFRMCCCAANAELHSKIKNFNAHFRLSQGHLHIPHTRPNLISSLMMLKTDKWQRAHHTQRTHITKNVADVQPHIQTASEIIHQFDCHRAVAAAAAACPGCTIRAALNF